MKRYLYTASVKAASGTQTFYVDARNKEEADARLADKDTDGIYMHDVEVIALDEFEFEGETEVTDFGDFPEPKGEG